MRIKVATDSETLIIAPFLLGLTWLGLGLISWPDAFWIHLFAFLLLIAVSVFFLLFFRDPERVAPTEGIVSPADGVVKHIKNDGGAVRIAVFMNVHNVHVNRAPMDGRITDIRHVFGGYLPAFKKESERNERTYITMDTEIGRIEIVQIAGAMVRRIVTYVREGDEVRKGQRIGMIRFGSRVDLILPGKKVKVMVKLGDKVKAGESVIALLTEV